MTNVPDSSHALIVLEQTRQALAEVNSLEVVKGTGDQVDPVTNVSDCTHMLIVLEQTRQALTEVNSLAELKDIRNQAEALRQYVKSAAMGFEMQNIVAEIRLRVERKVGNLLRDLHLHGGDRRSSTHDEYLNLEKMGIDRNHSNRWQKMAKFPEDLFEGYLRECNDLKKEINGAAFLRYARQRTPQSPSDKTKKKVERLTNAARELAELVRRGETFSCISVYPPWPKPRRIGKETNAYRPDKRFVRQLRRLPIADLAAEDCHLHLWTNSEHLRNAIRLIDAWGFTYRSVLVCERPVLEYGAYWRAAQDFLVLGTKGHRLFKDNALESLIHADRVDPSGAEVIRRLIELVSMEPYLEVFSGAAGDGRTVVSE